ncbi:hypothetical protein PCYB_091020 [Plasmodium cynomolgi strain B]|uniref:Uncharacterized protein n=1 Tax=Plasmodium cynomolgi (strain B) TaxID=1120755 RepID=K6UDB6_PLACD|nr:hypothetical protein PCYB_091020 [Plasmodium cynomolgi strain B]GAB66316.1 hypothetical protein PCYB_091020 [Plasmodium cynomolgi strain B]
MAHSTGSQYSLHSLTDDNKSYSSSLEQPYVSEPDYPTHPIISDMFYGTFPSYYIDDEDDEDDDREYFLRKESKIGQDPKPDENETDNVENKTEEIENKTAEVENKTEEVGNPNKMLTFFQVVMIIVLLLRLGRKRCVRLRRKHEARKHLLKYLDKVNTKIKKDDSKMQNKLKKMEAKIKREENQMEEKWKKRTQRTKDKISKKPAKVTLPGIGPYYDKDKVLMDKKMDSLDVHYERDKYRKKRRWGIMKSNYHNDLKEMQDKQERRKLKKCQKMYKFEKEWNFGPKTMKRYLKQKEREYDYATNYGRNEQLKREEEKKAKYEAKGAEAGEEEDDDENDEEEEEEADRENEDNEEYEEDYEEEEYEEDECYNGGRNYNDYDYYDHEDYEDYYFNSYDDGYYEDFDHYYDNYPHGSGYYDNQYY